MSHPHRQKAIISEQAAGESVSDGMTVAIGEPHPMALVRSIVRRQVRDLTVIASGFALDILIAAGCVKKVVSYYAGGGVGVPVAPAFRRAAEAGTIEVWECEEGILTTALEAAAKGLPSLTCRGGVGTSLPEVNPDLRQIEDPVSGEPLIAVPALSPDVCLLHAGEADIYGNVRHVGGPGWIDLFYHRAAKHTIVQVERTVSNESIRANPWATTIGGGVDIVRMPYGAHPFFSRGYYIQDRALINEYFAASAADGAELRKFLDRFCNEPANHVEYLERIGLQRLFDLYEY